jgi:uncharacterized oligopeptide transporter (OPT) family protein
MDEVTAKILVEQMKKAKGEDAGTVIRNFVLAQGLYLGSALVVGLFFLHFLGVFNINPWFLYTSIFWVPVVTVMAMYIFYFLVIGVFSLIAGIVWALFGGGKKRG